MKDRGPIIALTILQHWQDEGGISFKISQVRTEIALSTLEDLAEQIRPDETSIGDNEEHQIEDVQSALEDLAEQVLPDDEVPVAIPEEGVPKEADPLVHRQD